ncbi:MAG: PD-(D/E)XK nuclease family protein [Steroidobacteraceae bacterium]
MAHELTFDEASHVYRLDGVVVPSVTQLLQPIRPDFDRIPPAVLEAKRALGIEVHFACELDDDDDLDEDSVPAAVEPYLQAWRKFKADAGVEVLANERKLVHVGLRFAGTLDRLVRVRAGDVYLIDLKTSISMAPSFGVQLAGYQLLLEAADDLAGVKLARKGLQLRDDGTYRLIPYENPNDVAAFRACLSLHHWKASQP